ncbi:MAG TPA: LysE family transporter [bacterium]|nr:LysE family transporter [bacterium]
MHELALLFIGSFTLALSGALMPGPLLTVCVADSAKRGFIAGPLLISGHAVLELALVVAVIFGLGPILEMGAVIGAIALCGGAILVWMGTGMIRGASKTSLNMEAGCDQKPGNPVIAGIFASISNPYWILWWATIGLGYLTAAKHNGAPGVAAFFFGHILADLAWYSMISFGVSRGKKLMSDRIYQGIIRFCGALLLVFGAWFLYTSGSYLIW